MDIKTSIDAFIDIETLPTNSPAVVAQLQEGIKPPKTHKKPETIAAWMREEAPIALATEIAMTALDGTYGRVLSVGMALDDGPVEVWIGEEVEVLTEFFFAVTEIERVQGPSIGEYQVEVNWIGHNVRAFDIRFLYQRAVINKLKMPRTLREAALSRSWPRGLQDTMLLWNPQRDYWINLGNLCRAIGVPSPKTDMDGSKVAAAFAAGEIERIRAYQTGEIEALRSCYRRMTFA
jgi:predicted PolB exonuclease-like 3'-5' exonuclease